MAARAAFVTIFALFVPFLVAGESCTGAKPNSKVYSTSNILLSSETVFVAEFSLECDNNPEDLNLYAEVNGKVMPVTRSPDDKRYQVSWAEEHKKAKSGVYKINFLDEEGYAAYRKAQRSGTSTDFKPLFTIDINHKGAGREGLWVQTEFIAVVAALLIWWCANNVKSRLQES